MSSCEGVVRRTLLNLYCLYSSTQAILKLSQTVSRDFVMLIEVGMHLFSGNNIAIVVQYNEIPDRLCRHHEVCP